jgi:rubrerythrin
MPGGFLSRFKRLVGNSLPDSQSGDETCEAATHLYECPQCETVYIDDAMQSCPECDAGVTQVPNELTRDRDDASEQ